MNEYEMIGHVAAELSKGTKMENIEEVLVKFYSPEQIKKLFPRIIKTINRAGQQTKC